MEFTMQEIAQQLGAELYQWVHRDLAVNILGGTVKCQDFHNINIVVCTEGYAIYIARPQPCWEKVVVVRGHITMGEVMAKLAPLYLKAEHAQALEAVQFAANVCKELRELINENPKPETEH